MQVPAQSSSATCLSPIPRPAGADSRLRGRYRLRAIASSRRGGSRQSPSPSGHRRESIPEPNASPGTGAEHPGDSYRRPVGTSSPLGNVRTCIASSGSSLSGRTMTWRSSTVAGAPIRSQGARTGRPQITARGPSGPADPLAPKRSPHRAAAMAKCDRATDHGYWRIRRTTPQATCGAAQLPEEDNEPLIPAPLGANTWRWSIPTDHTFRPRSVVKGT